MISAALTLASYLHLADLDGDMNELGRPFRRAGRAIGDTANGWGAQSQEALGLGDEATDSFMCSDPGFFVIKQEAQLRDATSWVLKGALHVPYAGFAYHYRFLGLRGPEAFVQLQVGQRIGYQYQQQAAPGPLQVMEKFTLPPGIGLLHVMVAGGGPGQQEIRCDITSVKQ